MHKKAYEYSIFMLSKREHSSFELSNKLKGKKYPNKIIDEILQELQSKNYQSDSRFSQMIIRSKSSSYYGENYIRQLLTNHKIDRNIMNESFNIENINWDEILLKLWQKKYQKIPENFKEKQKQNMFFLKKGFTFEQIKNLWISLK